MKKYLFIALAALGFAACEKSADENKTQQNAEWEQSYVSITLAADDITRADDGKYEEGLAAEREVKSAYVFFFQDGKAFHVSFDGTTSTNSGASNWLKVELTGSTSGMDNVSDIKDQVLVLQNYKGEYPNQMLAILNWTPEKASYTLSELQTKVASAVENENGFVMSNSVYANSKKQTIDAVPLTIENIGKTADEAKANPVTIHVERIAAKVVYSAANNGKFMIGKNVENTEIYAQIESFELYNDYEESRLLKKIDPTWDGIGFAWNDADWFRSYWAISLGTAFPENAFNWKDDNTKLNEWDYLGENTTENHTKVIIKAKLVNNNGETVEIVNWYGKDYIGEDNLKVVVANTLKSLYFWGDGYTFNGLSDADLQCVSRSSEGKKAFEVYFQLSNNGSQKNWYKYENGNYNAITVDALNAELADVQPALVYNDGMTYYSLDIKHLGNTGSTTEYGIVRNHVYKVNITDIKGFGTPIYDPEQDFVTPEKPEDIVTYVSAQINILSWRVVEGNYNVQ